MAPDEGIHQFEHRLSNVEISLTEVRHLLVSIQEQVAKEQRPIASAGSRDDVDVSANVVDVGILSKFNETRLSSLEERVERLNFSLAACKGRATQDHEGATCQIPSESLQWQQAEMSPVSGQVSEVKIQQHSQQEERQELQQVWLSGKKGHGERGQETSSPSNLTISYCLHEGDAHRLYGWKESIWDAAVLQWFCKSRFDFFMVVLVYFLNLGLQIVFVYLVHINMSSEEWVDEEDIEGVANWRIGVAQRMEYYHEPSNTSLATRVCTGDGSNILSAAQSDIFESIQTYKFFNKPFNGPMLCILAILIWLVVIMHEVKEISEFMIALASLDRDAGKIAGSFSGIEDDLVFSIASVTCGWCTGICAFVVIPRLIIALWLGWSGVLYLAQSSEMGDLILNCMALEFILELDELFYMFVPKRTSWLLSVTEEVQLNADCVHLLGLRVHLSSLFSPLLMLSAFPMLIATLLFLLWPMYERLDTVYSIMCGGSTNLVFARDQSNNIMTFAGTAEQAWGDQKGFYEYRDRAVLQALGIANLPDVHETFADIQLPQVPLATSASLEKMRSLVRQTKEEAMKQQLCQDVDYDSAARAALQDSIGMEHCNMTSADDMWGRCKEANVRRFCPVTCSCQAVSWWHNRSGCPSSCGTLYQENLLRYVNEKRTTLAACYNDPYDDKVPYFGGNLTHFASFVQDELIRSGEIGADGKVSNMVQQRVRQLSFNFCSMKEVPFSLDDIMAMAPETTSKNPSYCGVLAWIDMVFQNNLCNSQYRYAQGLGDIAAFCPKACSSCPGDDLEPADFFDLVMSALVRTQPLLMQHFTPFMQCGYEWIFCGQTLTHTTGLLDDGNAVEGLKSFTFWAASRTPYNFTVSTRAGLFNFNIGFFNVTIFDAKMSRTPVYTFRSSLSGRVLLRDVTFSKTARYHLRIVVGKGDKDRDFHVSMSSNRSDCGQLTPQEIRCNDVMNISAKESKNRVSLFGGRSRESLFSFWADAGTQYNFTGFSFSPSPMTLYLYDSFFTYPALASSDSGGYLLVRFDRAGRYHIAIEPSSAFGRAPDMQLEMQCLP